MSLSHSSQHWTDTYIIRGFSLEIYFADFFPLTSFIEDQACGRMIRLHTSPLSSHLAIYEKKPRDKWISRGIIVYMEYQSVCPFVGIGSPLPLPACGYVFPIAGGGGNLDDWTGSLALYTLWMNTYCSRGGQGLYVASLPEHNSVSAEWLPQSTSCIKRWEFTCSHGTAKNLFLGSRACNL
jgi:hypothetical protein